MAIMMTHCLINYSDLKMMDVVIFLNQSACTVYAQILCSRILIFQCMELNDVAEIVHHSYGVRVPQDVM